MPDPISPERAAQIRQLFEELSELPESDRAEFLERACGDEPTLRHELTSLLRHSGSATLDFDNVAQSIVTSMLEALREDSSGLHSILDNLLDGDSNLADLMVGRSISHFDIIERIGRGGESKKVAAEPKRSSSTPAPAETSSKLPSPRLRQSWLGPKFVTYRSGSPSLSMSPTATPMP